MNASTRRKRSTDARAVVRAIASATPTSSGDPTADTIEQRRRRFADVCKAIGGQLAAKKAPPQAAEPTGGPLTPRLRQTLERMLAGDSEKQIAIHLQLSRHTVHIYVKSLYRAYEVNSRGELLAKFVAR